MAEAVVQAVFAEHSGWSDYSIHLLVGSASLWIGLIISFIGANCFTKVNVPLFILQFFAIFWGFFSMYFSPDPCAPPAAPINNITGHPCGSFWCDNGTDTVFCGQYRGWSASNLADNSWFGFSSINCNGNLCSWVIVYGVVFTAMTGIFEGANLSGDCKYSFIHSISIRVLDSHLLIICSRISGPSHLERDSNCSFRSLISLHFRCCDFCWWIRSIYASKQHFFISGKLFRFCVDCDSRHVGGVFHLWSRGNHGRLKNHSGNC